MGRAVFLIVIRNQSSAISDRALTGLARAISKSGYCSRSVARSLIASGRVRVSGHVIRDPEKPVTLGGDVIEVDGAKIAPAKRVYVAMNKPRGIVTSARDEKGRASVYSLLPQDCQWVAPVGRLDKASEGLLLLTNDTGWGARILSPDSHVEKVYHVQITTIADQELVNRLIRGKTVNGDFLRVKRAAIIRVGNKNSWLEIVLDEGKNRHIRRLLAAFSIRILRLIRIAIGTVVLGDLPKGKHRELTRQERNALGQDGGRRR